MIVYIEEQLIDNPRAQKICAFFPQATVIPIKHYKNIFDKQIDSQQRFEKCRVIAAKKGNAIHEAPWGYGHSDTGYFFTTVLNCLFDCQYCYLKGAFKNDFPVIFINYEDIAKQITDKVTQLRNQGDKSTIRRYMSDRSDTQGFDTMLGLHEYFFTLFDTMEDVMMETRTKAANINTLQAYVEKHGAAPRNVEIAYSLNPQILIDRYEKGTASLDTRLENIRTLLALGYKVGLRFMPLLPVQEYKKIYSEFLQYVTQQLPMEQIFSSFAGGLLFTQSDYKKMLIKEPNADFLYRLESSQDGFWREKKQVRDDLYALFQDYIDNCFICLDTYDVKEN